MMNVNVIDRGFIEQLRSEASEVKSCFTTFSFQAITFSSAMLAIIFGSMKHFEYVVYAGIPVVLLLMIVSRIGIYKYATANRHYGYELYINKAKYLVEEKAVKQWGEWQPYMQKIGWEEALRAWRIVQTTIFRSIYKTHENNKLAIILNRSRIFKWINYLRTDLYSLKNEIAERIETSKKLSENDEDNYPWFLITQLVKSKVENTSFDQSFYHAGTYLRNMLSMLQIMQYLLLSPLILYLYNTIIKENDTFLKVLWLLLLVSLILIVVLRGKRVKRRLDILESELLSIHSCSIIWRHVVIAHYQTLSEIDYYTHYSEKLLEKARNISNNIFKMTQQ